MVIERKPNEKVFEVGMNCRITDVRTVVAKNEKEAIRKANSEYIAADDRSSPLDCEQANDDGDVDFVKELTEEEIQKSEREWAENEQLWKRRKELHVD